MAKEDNVVKITAPWGRMNNGSLIETLVFTLKGKKKGRPKLKKVKSNGEGSINEKMHQGEKCYDLRIGQQYCIQTTLDKKRGPPLVSSAIVIPTKDGKIDTIEWSGAFEPKFSIKGSN